MPPIVPRSPRSPRSPRFPRGSAPLVVLVSLGFLSSPGLADTKRGIAGGTIAHANAINARYYYKWSHLLEPGAFGFHGSYVPMIWSGNTSNVNAKIDTILAYANGLGVEYVLGFNEHERANQANMSVQQAIDVWEIMTDRFEGTGIKLVSPAVSDNAAGRAWLDAFMGEVESRNADADPDNDLRVDEIAFHWYGAVSPANPQGSATTFLSRVDDYHATYGRDVWITEFAGLDFDADDITSPDLIAANAAFLEAAVPGLESRNFVRNYSWWQFGQSDSGEENDSKLMEDVGGVLRPTVIGNAYIPDLDNGDVVDLAGSPRGTDYFYLRGGTITNSGAALGGQGVGHVYALSGVDGSLVASTLEGDGDWGMPDGGWVRVEPNATLRKAGPNTIEFGDVAMVIDGQLRLMGTSGDASNPANTGTLWIHGPGTTASGMGKLRLDPGSTLRLGRDEDTSGFALPIDMDMRGGDVTAAGPGIDLGGDLTVFTRTDIRVTTGHTLTVSGALTSTANGGGSGIDKEGYGTLVLNGVNTYVGDTRVSEGTLAGSGSASSSHAIVSPGATLSPGVSVGSLGFASARIDGTLAIEFDGAGIDLLELSGDVNLAEAYLELIELSPITGSRLVFATYGGVLSGGFASVGGLPVGYAVDLSVPHEMALVTTIPTPWSAGLLFIAATGAACRRPVGRRRPEVL